MREKFESCPDHRERMVLMQELAATLELKTRGALYGVEDIEHVSFHTNEVDTHEDERAAEERDDLIVGEVITRYTDSLATVRRRLMEWFGVIGYHKEILIDEETGYFIIVINEHDKPEGWDGQLDMPITFKLKFTSAFDKWMENQSVRE
ncbi:MAG: hypothetical protein ABIP74_05220 [Candidatus Saccharimonas sp.]